MTNLNLDDDEIERRLDGLTKEAASDLNMLGHQFDIEGGNKEKSEIFSTMLEIIYPEIIGKINFYNQRGKQEKETAE